MKIATNLDMLKNQLQNVVGHLLSTAPASPVEGQEYYNTADHRKYYYNGTTWIAEDAADAAMSGADIVAAINGSSSTIDKDNLSADLQNTSGTNTGDETTTTLGSKINGATAKTTPVDADMVGLMDSAASNVLKKLSWANIKATLKAYMDTVYVLPTRTINGHALSADVSVTASDVGLGNVTNNTQVKKAASSTNGYIPKWSGTSGDAIVDGYSVETTLSGGSSALPRADAVKTYVDALLGANDAMVFKGTLGTGGTITALPTAYSAGWAYKVITAATYAGKVCEIGDLIIAIADRAGSGNLDADWTVVQTNIDGAVTGPASATDGNIALFDGTTGKIIKNSAYSPASFASAAHNHDGTYPKKYSAAVGNASDTSFTLTHNLNTRECAVCIRETSSPYAQVFADVTFPTVNTVAVAFATTPASSQYTVTIIG